MPLGTASTPTGPAMWPPAPHSTTFRVLALDSDTGHRNDTAGTSVVAGSDNVAPAKATEHGQPRKGEASKERGERTRAKIAQAVIDLLSESGSRSGNLPTAKEIAARAGVSVRLVFHHFEDLDALYSAVARTQIERHWRPIRPVPPDLPLPERIERTVAQRVALFETISPVRRRAVTLAPRHQAVAEGLDLTSPFHEIPAAEVRKDAKVAFP
jgi:AcrR family transcriptional regulator